MLIHELEINKIKQYKKTNVIPIFIQYHEECFEIANEPKQIDNAWPIFQKIMYFKLSEEYNDYFNSLYGARLFQNDYSKGVILFSRSDATFGNEKALGKDTAVKFAKYGYVRVESEKNRYNNIILLNKILVDTKAKDLKIYVALADDLSHPDFKKEYNLLKRQFQRKRKNPYRTKKANLVVGHINGIILSEKEKLIKYVRDEYQKHNLLGDIILDDRQEAILNEYMKEQLSNYANNSAEFEPDYRRLFALGLVRYAMKNYNKKHSGDFWPHFKTDYGVEIYPYQQKKLHEIFESIVTRYGMPYEKNAANKIDNITMHCFVADNSAFQLFDYFFDFWRLDLNRNADNLNTDDGRIALNSLVEAMKTGTQDVMTHTSLLLNFAKTSSSFKSRIKRIIKLMNDSFWESVEINETGNRINHLLNQWIAEPKGAFLKEKNYVARNSTNKKGEILFHTPVLNMKTESADFCLTIILPHQRLIECNEKDFPEWVIQCDDGSSPEIIPLESHYKHDRIGFYTERMTYEIPLDKILHRFDFQLVSNGVVLKKYSISSSPIRLFNQKGACIDHNTSIVPEGVIYSFSESERYPTVIGESNKSTATNGLYFCTLNLTNGQVVVLKDDMGVQVGQKICEGLSEAYPIKGAVLRDQGNEYQIYNSLPKLLFKSSDNDISGVSLVINGNDNRIVDRPYKEFKLADDLKANGYLLDLHDYIDAEGLYSIEISYPKMHVRHSFGMFAFIKNFKYQFDKSVYIFEESATIIFDSTMNIIKSPEEKDNWKTVFDKNYFNFNFGDKDSEHFCKDVIDGRLERRFKLKGKEYDVCFEIPALYWKYNENEEWNVQHPVPVLLKSLKQNIKRLYVKGPFNFNLMPIITTDSVDIAEEESEIKYQGTNHPYYEISKLYDWFKNDRSDVYKHVFLKMGDLSLGLFDVMCKSELKDVNLIADYQNNILKGIVDIVGNEDYTISIYHNGKTICEDEQIIDGSFEIETEIETGTYMIYVYELEESDENGFDVETNSILLNNQPIQKELTNINNLEGKTIYLKGYQDNQKKFLPHYFSQKFALSKLTKTCYEDILSDVDFDSNRIYGIWNEEVDPNNDDEMNQFIYYRAKLFRKESDNKYRSFNNVVVIFTDHMNPESILLLNIDEGKEYSSLYIYKHGNVEKIISPTEHKKQLRNSECFYDDRNHYLLKIGR